MPRRSGEVRDEVFARDCYECQVCSTKHNITNHHIHRLFDGGKDDVMNCITLCRKCHDAWHKVEESKQYDYRSFYRWLETERKKVNKSG